VSAAVVKHLDPTQVELEIAISPEELVAAQDRAFRQLVRTAKIPGFRPGKAPRKVFEAQYGSQIIAERAMEAVVPDVYSRALRENQLSPVDEPQMELLPEEDGLPLRLRATVSVRPPITLGTYKGMALEAPPVAIGDEEVDRSLEMLRRDHAMLVPVERPVELGDVPTLDYEGRIDGVAFEGGKAEGAPTEIGEDRFIPGFAQGIVGMSAGETKDVEARFPDDYSKTDLAGKTAVFSVTVHENKVPELPPLDDDFARRFSPEATVDKLREDLRGRLEAAARSRVRRALQAHLMDRLLADARSYITRAGLSWESYLREQGKTQEEARAGYRVEAQRRVKGSLLIEEIARAEKIEATDRDIEAEIQSLSRQYGQPREAILEMLKPNFSALVDGIVRQKTVDKLLEWAAITETAAPPGALEATGTAQT
jgi:trigger factor